jgi:hypothetical protein
MPRVERRAGVLALAALLVGPQAAAGTAGSTCGPAIRGLDPLLRSGKTVLFGEIHGTTQVPRFVGDVACRAAAAGLAVALALEVGVGEEPAFARYLASQGGAADRAQLLAGALWRSPFPDGRSSQAMVDLLEQMRRLRARGAVVTVHGLLEPSPDRDGDQVMAARALAVRRQHPRALLLVLAGNNHTRIADWPDGPRTRAMGQLLRASGLTDLVSLTMSSAGGTFFGISGGAGVHPISGSDRGGRRFIQLTGDAGPFDGQFYVGRVTASLPAVPVVQGVAR